MPTKSGPGFDAVAENRRWKEAVAAETASLSGAERMAWFRRQSSIASIRDQAQSAAGGMVLREELHGERHEGAVGAKDEKAH